MYKKILISLLLSTSLLTAQEINNEKFQLIAKNIDSKENIITAVGSVVIYSPTYYLSADKIIYDKEKETFELFDNVLIIKDNNIQTQSNHAFVDLKNELSNQSPMFLYENTNNIWMNTKESNKEKEIIQLDSSIISSCDCLDPAWSIRASSADYDTEAKWINAYNPRLYIKDVPVFYSPYFGFPTDKTRRTGLLFPTLGYSREEGVYYSQPIYFAPAQNYDLEFVPQIRTFRGKGGYLYYRYADSPDSMLNVKGGLFREDGDYREENSLDHQEHFGLNVDYSRKNIFANQNTEDGLFTSIKYLNDVEYITLEDDEQSISTDKKVESKINYFYNTPDYYMGTYARYYIDTSKKSNSNTLQELPQAHFHSYNKEVFIDNLLYSIDTKVMNYTRPEGLTANVYEISVPISYSKYFLDDYLYLTVENKTIISKYDYDNFTNNDYEDGNLIQNRTSILVGSDLIKPYENYLHTMNLGAEYVIPKNLKEDGDLYKITTVSGSTKENELKAFPITQEEKNINLTLNQSLYEKNSLKQLINHKMSQSILYDEVDNPKFEDFENYVKVNHDFGSISGRVVYNMDDNTFVENSISNTLSYEDFSLTAGYYKSKKTDNTFNDRDDLESYRFNTSYKISKDYKITYYENYNILEKTRNKQGISFNINDNCWNLDLKYEKEVIPETRYNDLTNKYDSKEQEIIFVNLILKPLGGIKQKYKMENDN
ncbi:LPS-assembly protein LptD [Arcobacter defluvii]|uniref:Lipooligosaccharide transport system, OM translocon component LptD n=1 Tax=Arcobacter defluvii TaxID=873191 RepID=A0AAE7BGZ1_9BACT|nr:LPS assembly protein LptD [Arcobacter defluvii]QKF77574.1 lipooligosaccharide transport system, OM translocon component LptD [Arcobacter defluvii]RXI31725.1 organic solvent tolerance protein [Arcobacter defluvii]